MRVIAELWAGRVHVSELARRLGLSRPLLYMHLDKLEKAGLVSGHLELSEDGKAMKYYELAPFEIHLSAEAIAEAVRDSAAAATDGAAKDGAAKDSAAKDSAAKDSAANDGAATDDGGRNGDEMKGSTA